METNVMTMVTLDDAPAIPGLRFRRFRGPVDYPIMAVIINANHRVNGVDHASTNAEDVARNYDHLLNSDPARDILFAEVNGEAVGYSRVWWQEDSGGTRIYAHFAFFAPEGRGKGIRRALVCHNERRLREIAAEHPAEAPKRFEAWASELEQDWSAILEGAGYAPARYFYEMVRPDLEEIPDLQLPEGLEVRPVPPEHYRTVWDAAAEAFQDHWGATAWYDEWFKGWLEEPTFNPDLWQVAWDGDEVAGMVLNFIDEKQNAEFDRKRGYTETICVRRPWRKMGLARALIARSFHVLKAQGMTEAALGVDVQNPSGALQLYESMGFRKVRSNVCYQKPLA